VVFSKVLGSVSEALVADTVVKATRLPA
jgi:hypothetical protein